MHPTDQLVPLGRVRIARAAADKGVRERRAKALSDLAEMDADYLDAGCEADPWTRLHSAAALETSSTLPIAFARDPSDATQKS